MLMRIVAFVYVMCLSRFCVLKRCVYSCVRIVVVAHSFCATLYRCIKVGQLHEGGREERVHIQKRPFRFAHRTKLDVRACILKILFNTFYNDSMPTKCEYNKITFYKDEYTGNN